MIPTKEVKVGNSKDTYIQWLITDQQEKAYAMRIDSELTKIEDNQLRITLKPHYFLSLYGVLHNLYYYHNSFLKTFSGLWVMG